MLIGERQRQRQRKGMRGGEEKRRRGEKDRERWVGRIDWVLCTGRLCNVKWALLLFLSL